MPTITHDTEKMRASKIMLEVADLSRAVPFELIKLTVGNDNFRIRTPEDAKAFQLGMLAALSAADREAEAQDS